MARPGAAAEPALQKAGPDGPAVAGGDSGRARRGLTMKPTNEMEPSLQASRTTSQTGTGCANATPPRPGAKQNSRIVADEEIDIIVSQNRP